MEHFEISSKSYVLIRRGLGILIMLTVLLWIYLYYSTSYIFYLFTSVSFLFLGIYQLTNGFGLERSWFRVGPDYLTVKWSNMISPIKIHASRIAKICLTKSKIVIYRKGGRLINLNISWLETDQKKDVFEFLIDYAKMKDIAVVRQF